MESNEVTVGSVPLAKRIGEWCGILRLMFLSSWEPQPVLLAFGSVKIYWYGLLLAVGALVGLMAMIRLAKPSKIGNAFVIDLFVGLVIGGFLGGRLYHVLNEWGFYRAHPNQIWQIWNGGLAIHGAMIVGLVILLLMARQKKINAWWLADLTVIGLAIGQAIGRWGNYFNQELFGGPTSLPWKIIIGEANRPAGHAADKFYHPTFLYESLGCLILFGILWLIFTKRERPQKPSWVRLWQSPGTVALTYFILYSALRIGVESLRIDRVPIVAGIRFPLLTSAIILIISTGLLIIRLVQQRAHAQSH